MDIFGYETAADLFCEVFYRGKSGITPYKGRSPLMVDNTYTCAICGRQNCDNIAYPLRESKGACGVISSTFGSYSTLRCLDTMLVCPSCEAINRKPFLGKGFVLTEKQVTLIYDKAVPEWDLPSVDIMPRNELWEVLLAPPKPPFVISLAVDKQYTLQHAIVNYSRDKFFVNKGVSKIAFSTNDLRNAAAETAKKIYDNPLTQWFLRQQLKSVLTSVASAPEPIAVLPLKKAKKSIKEECVAKAVACA